MMPVSEPSLTGNELKGAEFKGKKIGSFFYDGLWLTVNDKKELKKAEEYLKKYNSVIQSRK